MHEKRRRPLIGCFLGMGGEKSKTGYTCPHVGQLVKKAITKFASQVDTGEAQLYAKKRGKQWPNKKA